MAVMTNENMLPVGTLLRDGTYRITKQLSCGGFGNTYVVQNVSFDETYAMKEFFMRGVNLREGDMVTVSVSDNKATFESQKNKLKKEAQRLRKLHNSHIVRVHDLFEERGTVYYVMDYIDGESLSDRLQRTGKPLAESEALDYMRQVLDALKVVHSQAPQLLHLDIKPANIMVDGKGCAYLIDFGASKQLSADESYTLSTTTGMSYTAGYAPSEQIEQNYDRMGPWTDYYALGATLYRVLTMQQPPSPSEIGEEPDDAFHFTPAVSPTTQKLIKWMMSPNRKKRPQRAEEIVNFLEEEDGGIGDLIDDIMDCADEDDNESTSFEHSVSHSAASFDGESTMFDGTATPSKSLSSKDIHPIISRLLSNMVHVEGGTFMMGADLVKNKWWKKLLGAGEYQYDSDVWYDEKPAHQVTLSSFYIGKYEVTQEEWEAVMGSNPSYYKGAKRPVEQVSWDDCQEFIRKLNALTGKQFRLPTEAEWEYAARGGNRSQGYKYAGSNNIGSVAWYDGNSGRETHPVGQKQANELGLYDMAGNVYEWCQDWYDRSYYGKSPSNNPVNNTSASIRVIRGGSWASRARRCRVSFRYFLTPADRGSYLGLRLAL